MQGRDEEGRGVGQYNFLVRFGGSDRRERGVFLILRCLVAEQTCRGDDVQAQYYKNDKFYKL
jgi:hypothetical protein